MSCRSFYALSNESLSNRRLRVLQRCDHPAGSTSPSTLAFFLKSAVHRPTRGWVLYKERAISLEDALCDMQVEFVAPVLVAV